MLLNDSEIDDSYVIKKQLSGQGIAMTVGSLTTRVAINFPSVQDEFLQIYGDYPFFDKPVITDYYLEAYARNFYRRYIRPQVAINTMLQDSFVPLPATMGLLSLEMGMNWQVAFTCKTHVLLHAGVVERDGVGVIIPAISGSGKSTLSAGLAYDGWRFFSDEFGMVDPVTGQLFPYPRPISLKNESIAVMKEWVNDENAFSKEYEGTPKGTICYLRPPTDSLRKMHEPAKPHVVIHPVFKIGASPKIEPLTKTMAYFRLVKSSANYGDMGEMAFQALTKVADDCVSYEITYSSLEEGIALVNKIVNENIS